MKFLYLQTHILLPSWRLLSVGWFLYLLSQMSILIIFLSVKCKNAFRQKPRVYSMYTYMEEHLGQTTSSNLSQIINCFALKTMHKQLELSLIKSKQED